MKSWKEKIKKVSSKSVGGAGGGSTSWGDLLGDPLDNGDFETLYTGLIGTDSALDGRIDNAESVLSGTLEQISELNLDEGDLLYCAPDDEMAALKLGANLSITGGVLNSSGGGASSLAGLSDVEVVSPFAGELLKYNGDDWVNSGLDLEEIDNVVITSPSLGHMLRFNGTNWENYAPTSTNVLYGRVAASGEGSGTGWTVTKMGVGDYRLNFSPTLPTPPALLVTIEGPTVAIPRVHSLSTTSARVSIWGVTETDVVDSAFSFSAVPVPAPILPE